MPTPDTSLNEARTILRDPIDSSGIKAVGYDEARQILALEFHSGTIFHYYKFTLQDFERFGAAASRGQFYAREIKGKFVGKAMTGLCSACQAKGLIGEPCGYCEDGVIREVDRTHGEG